MAHYFYLMAQLPALVFGQQPGIDRSRFLAEARAHLAAADERTLTRVDSSAYVPHEGPALLRAYALFDERLRGELSAWRQARAAGNEYRMPHYLMDAVSGNPLEVEKKLMHIHWKFLEGREFEYPFCFEAVLIYFLKLRLLERLFSFDKEKGLQQFDQLCGVKL